jgi:hypothetical protein
MKPRQPVSPRRAAAVTAADFTACAITALALAGTRPALAFGACLALNAGAAVALPAPGVTWAARLAGRMTPRRVKRLLRVPVAILRTIADLLRMAAWDVPGAARLRGRRQHRHCRLSDTEIAVFWRDEARRARP